MGGGSIFWKTREKGLPSYNILSTHTANEDEKMAHLLIGDRRSEVLGPEARGGRLEGGGQASRHLHSGRPSKESLYSSGQDCHRLWHGLKGP